MTASSRIHVRVLPYGSEDGAISLPVGGGLHAWYGVDTDAGLERLTLSHMIARGLSLDAVRRAAADDLWAQLSAVTVHRHSDSEPFLMATGATLNLAASTLVLDELWESLAWEVRGDVIVRVVNADDVRFCGAYEPGALERLMAGRVRRPLLRWTGRAWDRFDAHTNRGVRRAA